MTMLASDTIGVKQVNIRIPDELHQKLAALATRERRSITGQIIWLLERGIDEAERKRRGMGEPREPA